MGWTKSDVDFVHFLSAYFQDVGNLNEGYSNFFRIRLRFQNIYSKSPQMEPSRCSEIKWSNFCFSKTTFNWRSAHRVCTIRIRNVLRGEISPHLPYQLCCGAAGVTWTHLRLRFAIIFISERVRRAAVAGFSAARVFRRRAATPRWICPRGPSVCCRQAFQAVANSHSCRFLSDQTTC